MAENQNLPAEYMPVVQMVQKEDSIRKGVESLKNKILVSAGDEFNSWEKAKQENFLERTIINISKDEKLIDCFNSPEGKLSIIEAVEKAVSTGLQIGGKHAYLVPQPQQKSGKWITKVRFSIRDCGYYALLCGGKKPIFLDLRWGIVYSKENCTVDKGTGEVSHQESIAADKGDFIGCWVQSKKLNGQKEAQFYPVKKISQWRDSSKQYEKAVEGKRDDAIWMKWFEEMGLQACIRHFCDKYEKARELLSSALYDDEAQTTEGVKTSTESIDDALNQAEPAIVAEIQPTNEKIAQKVETKDEKDDEDLF